MYTTTTNGGDICNKIQYYVIPKCRLYYTKNTLFRQKILIHNGFFYYPRQLSNYCMGMFSKVP